MHRSRHAARVGSRSPEAPVLHCSSGPRTAFRIPSHWCCVDGNIVEHIQWYMSHFGLAMPCRTAAAWSRLELISPRINQGKFLTIYVFAEHQAPEDVPSINVHEKRLNGHNYQMYEMGDVTGVDFAVQAFLATQEVTPDILLEASLRIENESLQHFVFICSHATHRSVGVALLLAMLVYHNAKIVLTTKRTFRAAFDRGMLAT